MLVVLVVRHLTEHECWLPKQFHRKLAPDNLRMRLRNNRHSELLSPESGACVRSPFTLKTLLWTFHQRRETGNFLL